MDSLEHFSFFGVALLIGVCIVAFQWHATRRVNAVYQRLAKRFQGHCNVTGLWAQPTVNFVFRQAYVLLDLQYSRRNRQKCSTQLRISWPNCHFRCEVYPATALSRVAGLLGMRDVEIGSPRFDADYVITGSDVGELREFFTPAVQECIESLRDLGGNMRSFCCYGPDDPPRARDIYFAAGGGQLLIKKRGLIREYEQLERFVSLALELYDQATRASTEGIEFVGTIPKAKLSLKEVICQVCGEPVKLDAVFCRSCKTPHHKDCWEYYGACSTYGCGQRRYLVQRSR
ncbi:MAG: hypothetical protein O3C40_06305 [Planctomycetota bacterium]|nr:hypothetical protein [Planctomycetota bacterium]